MAIITYVLLVGTTAGEYLALCSWFSSPAIYIAWRLCANLFVAPLMPTTVSDKSIMEAGKPVSTNAGQLTCRKMHYVIGHGR